VPRYDAPPAGLPPLGVSRPMVCGKPEDDGYESIARAWWSGGLTWVGLKPAFVGGLCARRRDLLPDVRSANS
jgi:hypothetical protein